MTENKKDKGYALVLLQNKYAELIKNGEKRYPKRSDFTSDEVMLIKAHCGPWPRALEEAGIKPERDDDRMEKNTEKRIRAKRRRIEMRKKNEFIMGSHYENKYNKEEETK